MILIRRLLLCLSVLLCAPLARAEVPPLSPAALKEDATVIVTAKVLHIQTSDTKEEAGSANTEFAIEVSITKVLKGEGVSGGQKIVAKTWQARQRPKGWAGPGGQYEIPKEGAEVKLYLKGSKGDYTALLPNGIQAQK